MSTVLCETNNYHSGRYVATAYRDLIAKCATAHSDCYDDQQELVSSVTLSLLQYSKQISYPEQFVRVMTRNLAINRARTSSSQYELVESEIGDNSEGGDDSVIHDQIDTLTSTPVEHVLLQDTLIRLERMLSPAEAKCYRLLKSGLEQEDLPARLGVTRQAVCKIMKEIRRKFMLADSVEEAA